MTAGATEMPTEGTPAGHRMIAELRMVHRPLRRDVVALREALEVLDVATARPEDVTELLDGLTAADLTWQLKAGCAHFCAHLDAHHTLEDARMLPVMQRTYPELTGKIHRLRREHEEVKHLIVGIRTSAPQMDPEVAGSVRRVLAQITELADHLQAHLDYEEASLFPYFLQMDHDWH